MSLSIRAYARHRGVSDAAVRKAIKAGRIPQEPDGTVDPAKADAAWERNTNPAQQREPPANQGTQQRFAPPANQAQRFAPQPTAPKQGAPDQSAGLPIGTGQGPARRGAARDGGLDYQTSRAIREAYSARLVKLDFEERSEQLISTDEVKVEAFNLARRVRDRLMNIPHRMGAMLAAETDADAIERLIEAELRIALEELPE